MSKAPLPQLTDAHLNKLTREAASTRSKIIAKDPAERGLYIRIYPPVGEAVVGKRVWYWVGKDPNTQKTRDVVLGEYPAVGVGPARQLARDTRERVRQGAVPTDIRREQRALAASQEAAKAAKENKGFFSLRLFGVCPALSGLAPGSRRKSWFEVGWLI